MESNPYASPQSPRSSASSFVDLPHDVVLRGSMPIRDVVHTQWLILSRRWPYVVLCLGMYVVFVLSLGLLSSVSSLFGSTFLVVGLVVMPGILPFTLLMVFLRMRRDATNRVGIFAVTETIISTSGIRSNAGQDSVWIPWSTFQSCQCSGRVVLLFLKDSNNHLIVSRSKLERSEDWPILIEFLTDRFTNS